MNHPTTRLAPSCWSIAVLFLLTAVCLPAGEAVTAVYPNSAVIGTPTTIVIIGTGFTPASTPAVTIGGTSATTTLADSATQITATITLTGATGLRDVTVAAGTPLVTGFTAVQLATATVNVTITASISSTLALAWTANTTGKTTGDTSAVAWNLTGLAAGALRHTDSSAGGTDALNFEVINVGNAPTKITVSTPATSTSAGATWTHAAVPGSNAYALAVSDGSNLVTPAWAALTSPQPLKANATVAVNGTAPFELQFRAPVWDTSLVNQTIDIVVTATGP